MIINNIKFENRLKLSYYLKNNEVASLFDTENNFNKWYNIKTCISDDLKVIFLNTIRIINKNKHKGVINFFEINYSKFDNDRFQKYLSFINDNPKDRMSEKYFQFLYGNNYEEKLKEKKENIKITLETLIEKYGSEEGNRKWEHYVNTQKKSSKRTLEYWISKTDNNIDLAKLLLRKHQKSHRKKFIENKTYDEIKQFDNKNSNWRIEYWIDKDYSEEEAKDIISKRKKEDSMSCIEYWIKRNYSENDAALKSLEFRNKYCNVDKFKKVSKESLNLFEPIIETLKFKHIDFKFNDNEWFIYHNKKYYFYDLTIFYNNKKYIIEYNGESFHPNKKKLNENEWNNWKKLFSNETADIVHKQDLEKIEIAKQNGFEVLVLWSSDSIETNRIKILDLLNI